VSNLGYAESISALYPARLRAALGTDRVAPGALITGEKAYAQRVAAHAR
jgi:hypothetical protein